MPPSRPAVESTLAAIWRTRGVAACCLWPLSLVFGALVALRRALYRCGLLRVETLPVPLVVVGNLSVGGVGKTPVVIALVDGLKARGRHPGVIARGYRAAGEHGTFMVTTSSAAADCGDEPLLVARRCGVPVAIGADRLAAARLLLAHHPEVDCLVSDDGLQHYRLPRQVEIVVCDERGFQNGWLLPAGPLREPLRRLDAVDALLWHRGAASDPVPPAPTFSRSRFEMRLAPAAAWQLDRPDVTLPLAELQVQLANQTIHAVAGIGDPQRFFDMLRGLGFAVAPHAFPDHHPYVAADLDFAEGVVLTTEKDAVKFFAFAGEVRLPVWVIPVAAEITPALADFVLEKLDGCPPA